MGTMTVSVEDAVEHRFRERAVQKFGKQKGSLGKAVTQAMDDWAERHGEDAIKKSLQFLEKGFKMGRLKFKSRTELHER